MSTALSILAFTVVLGEAFTAVALSTLVPATFVEMCRALKLAGTLSADAVLQLLTMMPPLPGMPAKPAANATQQDKDNYAALMKPYRDAVQKFITDSNSIQLLVPTSAKIDATFSCGGGESYGENIGVEGVLQVVGVKAGMQALFELHSTTTVTLHVEFGVAQFTI